MNENSCCDCKHKRSIPGKTYIRCVKPDENMTGKQVGINGGWFYYPSLFDPRWMDKECDNFEKKSS